MAPWRRGSANPAPSAPSASPTDRTRSAWWCPATASSAPTARSPAMAAAWSASAGCSNTRASCCARRERPSRLVGHAVDQHADAFDLDHHLVAWLHPQRRIAAGADPGGGAGDDDVARMKLSPLRYVGDELRNWKDHLVQPRLLDRLAVQPGADA